MIPTGNEWSADLEKSAEYLQKYRDSLKERKEGIDLSDKFLCGMGMTPVQALTAATRTGAHLVWMWDVCVFRILCRLIAKGEKCS